MEERTMKTYVSLSLTNPAGDIYADGAATLVEVAEQVATFAARGLFTLRLDEPVAEAVAEREGEDAPDLDESMDGDFDSAMASAGLGTDEDYGQFADPDAGCFGDE
jgi:hypothetical protein